MFFGCEFSVGTYDQQIQFGISIGVYYYHGPLENGKYKGIGKYYMFLLDAGKHYFEIRRYVNEA